MSKQLIFKKLIKFKALHFSCLTIFFILFSTLDSHERRKS